MTRCQGTITTSFLRSARGFGRFHRFTRCESLEVFGQRVLKGLQYASMIMIIIIIDTSSIMINHIHHIKILDFDILCKFI